MNFEENEESDETAALNVDMELSYPSNDSGEDSAVAEENNINNHRSRSSHRAGGEVNNNSSSKNTNNNGRHDQEMQQRTPAAARGDERFADHRTSSSFDPQPLPGSAYMPPPKRRQSPPPVAQDLLRSAGGGTSNNGSNSNSNRPSSSSSTRGGTGSSRNVASSGERKMEVASSSSSQEALRRHAHSSTSTTLPVMIVGGSSHAAAAAQQQQQQQQHHQRRSSHQNDTLLRQPARRSASLDYDYFSMNANYANDYTNNNNNGHRSSQQHQQEDGIMSGSARDNNNSNSSAVHGLRSAPASLYGGGVGGSNIMGMGADSSSFPSSRLKQADPEDTNQEKYEDDDMDDRDPVPVSGWSVVEVSQEPGAGVPPSARSLHAATLLNGTMYVFGGFDGQTRVNSFFAFSFAGRRWSPVLPAANSGPPPSPRDRHVAVAFGNSIYVHGGFDGTSRVSDFWAFDFSTMTWREVVALQGSPPSARHSHCAAVMNHSLYIACGYDGSYKSDIYQFDFTLSRWSTIRVSGRRPRARYRATLNAVRRPSPLLLLHGGHDGTRHLADTHVFDLETQEWSSLAIDGVPPIPRDSHVSVVHGNSIYVFGGSSGAALNDLHELQLPSAKHQPAKWRPVNTGRGTQPQPRFCHAAVVYQDTLYSFGGYSGSERINEFITFDFALYDLTFEVPPSCINNDLRSMVNNPMLSDVTFLVDGREIYAHKLLLIRCEYFQSLFLGSMMESKLSRIPIEQVSYSVFLALLEYLYTDHVRIPLSSAMELFEAADLFMIPRLKTICEKRMLQSISVSNAASIFYAADMHSAMALRKKAKKYILSHFEDVSKTSSFEEMGRGNIDLVFELLKSR